MIRECCVGAATPAAPAAPAARRAPARRWVRDDSGAGAHGRLVGDVAWRDAAPDAFAVPDAAISRSHAPSPNRTTRAAPRSASKSKSASARVRAREHARAEQARLYAAAMAAVNYE